MVPLVIGFLFLTALVLGFSLLHYLYDIFVLEKRKYYRQYPDKLYYDLMKKLLNTKLLQKL